MRPGARGARSVESASDLSIPQLRRIAGIVHGATGIVLDESKHALVSGRLARRVRALGLGGYGDYLTLLEASPEGPELQELVNVITTNKTSFFREPHHFELLRRTLEAKLAPASRGSRKLRIWSAGCSTGEEPYSIAMTVAQALGRELSSWDVEIVATDVDTAVLATASAGIYPPDRVHGVAESFLGHFEPVVAHGKQALRVEPRLRDMISFRPLNFIDAQWPIRGPFDHLFCRNVTIYFDRPTQARLYPRLAAQLAPDGLFYAGHSENLGWCPEVLRLVGQTVYARSDASTVTRPPLRLADIPSGKRPSRPVPPRAPRLPASPAPTWTPRETPRGTTPKPWDRSIPEKSIVAGEVFTTREPTLVKTTLGSCISVCLFDPGTKVGGMNHFMLPAAKVRDASALYGIQAMEILINGLLKLGADRRRLVAKIAGACNVMRCAPGGLTVSDRNIAFIEEYLSDEGFPIVGRRVGASQALELRFRTDTGEAFIRAVEDVITSRIARRDAEYEREIAEKATTPETEDVTWFR